MFSRLNRRYAIPIVIGVAAVALLGGAGLAYLFVSSSSSISPTREPPVRVVLRGNRTHRLAALDHK